jgi:hypothetical protein
MWQKVPENDANMVQNGSPKGFNDHEKRCQETYRKDIFFNVQTDTAAHRRFRP